MELINQLAEQYAARYTSPEDSVLQQVYKQTYAQQQQPHMISGHVQGKLLEILSFVIKPKYVLEIGTFTGYSAICLAKGLTEDGELHTIEYDDAVANTALISFKLAGLERKIHLHTGNALEIIPQLNYTWDIVFIDADKINYVEYYKMVLPRLSVGGLIIADNVLFHGEVLEENIKGKNAIAIDEFNKFVAADETTEQVIVTLRDGLMLIKKKVNA